ncbi:fibroblast growth factor 3 isoform X2 [Anthonomus grandis grandis]|uniref:fibroblast growth factor 3 isoform X2 n=1 Tax=Anthonomus grandis grandis TaxID=2921223 RepID=UPI00216669F0|nr:fibroblast growth factor 3 isoform X2 [Anthonomus grandis grandis]
MVKALLLGLLLIAALARAAPPTKPPSEGEEDPAARSERSANLSHVTGTARKIQMFIKNRHLQLLPGGTVNGTTDDTSPYTIMQRTTIGIGQMKIQGVATCQYLCMDECGLLYGSMNFGEECIFNETIEATNYNKYSSSKYSNERRTFYLALNRRGQSRKVMIKARQQLGKLSSYTRVLTRSVTPEQHQLRHHHQCPPSTTHHSKVPEHLKCRKKKKKKKKRRKNSDKNEHELEPKRHSSSPDSQTGSVKCDIYKTSNNTSSANGTLAVSRDYLECQRSLSTVKKSNSGSAKQFAADKKNKNNNKKKKKNNNNKQRKRLDQVDVIQENTTTGAPTTTTPAEEMNDDDYTMESSTHLDWDDSTGLPDISKNFAESDHTQSNSD